MSKLRRMLCADCYDLWLRARPIGAGASCLCCGDRRRVHLRYFELASGFAVLCHNCAARAAAAFPGPRPRSPEGLVSRLLRERRHEQMDPVPERRVGLVDLFDATDLAVEIGEEPASAWEDVTRIHVRV